MRSIAFPSWVAAGSIAQNAAFICAQWQELNLAGKFGSGVRTKPEIGLCFFEHAACTAYTNDDLPQQLASLPVFWHVHLPLDLPFYADGGLANAQLSFDICNGLMRKVEFLGVKQAVLHPVLPWALPSGEAPWEWAPNSVPKLTLDLASGLFKFIDLWEDSGRNRMDLLLENQPGDDLSQLFKLAQLGGCGLCLDLAHLYMPPKNVSSQAIAVSPPYSNFSVSGSASGPASASAPFIASNLSLAPNAGFNPIFSPHKPANTLSAQALELLSSDFLQMVQMAHINAPGQKQSGHASLASLLPEAHRQYQKIISRLPKNSTLMLELFKWQQIEESIPFLKDYLA